MGQKVENMVKNLILLFIASDLRPRGNSFFGQRIFEPGSSNMWFFRDQVWGGMENLGGETRIFRISRIFRIRYFLGGRYHHVPFGLKPDHLPEK